MKCSGENIEPFFFIRTGIFLRLIFEIIEPFFKMIFGVHPILWGSTPPPPPPKFSDVSFDRDFWLNCKWYGYVD